MVAVFKKRRFQIEFTTAIGSLLGFGCHFGLNLHYINLLTFCILSVVTSLCFALVGILTKNRSLLISQAGWIAIAILGICKNS